MEIYKLVEKHFDYLKAYYGGLYSEDRDIYQARDIAELVIALRSIFKDDQLLVFSILKVLANR